MWPQLLANSIAAEAALLPGLAITGPAFGLPLSVLAGFLERPFVSRAGIPTHALWYSLQANLASLLVGYVCTLVVIPILLDPVGALLVWPIVALAISIFVEGGYLYLCNPTGFQKPWWIVAGNVFTAAVCVGIMFFVAWAREQYMDESRSLAPYEQGLSIFAGVASICVFLWSFVAARSR